MLRVSLDSQRRKAMNADPLTNFTPLKRITSRWIGDLHMKGKTRKLLEGNTGKIPP